MRDLDTVNWQVRRVRGDRPEFNASKFWAERSTSTQSQRHKALASLPYEDRLGQWEGRPWLQCFSQPEALDDVFCNAW